MRSVFNHEARLVAEDREPPTRGYMHPAIRISPDIDTCRAAVLDAIQREKRRPDLSGWRSVLESRPEGGTRIDVTTGEKIQ